MTEPLYGSKGKPLRQTPVDDPCAGCVQFKRVLCSREKTLAQRERCAENLEAEEEEIEPTFAAAVADFLERCHTAR